MCEAASLAGPSPELNLSFGLCLTNWRSRRLHDTASGRNPVIRTLSKGLELSQTKRAKYEWDSATGQPWAFREEFGNGKN